jgi:hypothetical protein
VCCTSLLCPPYPFLHLPLACIMSNARTLNIHPPHICRNVPVVIWCVYLSGMGNSCAAYHTLDSKYVLITHIRCLMSNCLICRSLTRPFILRTASAQVLSMICSMVLQNSIPNITAVSVYSCLPIFCDVFHAPIGKPLDFSQLMSAPVAC